MPAYWFGAEDSPLWILEGKQGQEHYALARWLEEGIEHEGLMRVSLKLLELSDLAKKRLDLVRAMGGV